MFSGASTVSYVVFLLVVVRTFTVRGRYNLPLFCILADPSTIHERILLTHTSHEYFPLPVPIIELVAPESIYVSYAILA